MRTMPALLVLALAACAPVDGRDGKEDISDSPVPWITDLAEGRAEAEKTGRPLFVVFRCVP